MRSAAPCTRSVSSSARARCASRACGFSRGDCSSASICRGWRNGEHPQQLGDDRVLDVEPELEEGVRRGQGRVEPDGAGLGLAELRAVGPGHQRRRQRVDAAAVGTADELDAGDDVAPLVGPTGLQRAAVVAVELQVVVRLQQLVAELGVGDSGAGQPGARRPRGPASGSR